MLTDKEAMKFSESYNRLREDLSKLDVSFPVEELQTKFKQINMPASSSYITQYVKAGMLVKEAKGRYSFPKQPVHFRRIQDAVTIVRRSISKYGKKHTAKMREQKHPSEETLKIREKEAIAFLKSRGFRILAAETRWYEC